jgi:two-component system, NarL family, sensor histidine kinase UhpB
MPTMKDYLEIAQQFKAALEDYLRKPEEAALANAYELGRRSMMAGMGILKMAVLQHQALLATLQDALSIEECLNRMKAAENFLVEALSPFEMVHRGFSEANSALLRLNETLEEEVKRIAHLLHDEAGQLLAAVHLAIEDVARELPPPARERMGKVRDFLGQMEVQLRRLSHELRPTILDDLGLIPALEFLAEGVSKRTGLSITVEGPGIGRLPPKIETAFYRIVQEALNNVTHHARATRVDIRLQHEAQAICCSIGDNGVGFDVPSVLAKKGEKGLGLIGIRERLNHFHGTFKIIATPGQGTKLQISIPLESRDANPDSPRR